MNWKKSTYSGSGNCVETAEVPDGGMAVRDTKDRDGGMLTFGARTWRQFTSAVKSGRAS